METRVSILTATAAQILADLPHGNGEKPDIPALLAFWKENKYPLLALNHSNGWQTLWDSAEFKTAREGESNLLSSLRAEYVAVRDRWDRAGIPCLLIKSGGSAPSFPYTSDNLDVLVKEEHEEAARAILRELGYVELKNIEEPKKFLFRKFTGGECVSAIHLHTQVGWEVGFMDEDSLWKRSPVSPDDEAVTVPSPEDVILITVAHSFYENKQFRLADIVKIRECWRMGTIDWEYLERVADQRGWLDGLCFCLLVCAHLEKTLWGKTSVPWQVHNDWRASLKRLPLTYSYYRRITSRSPVSLPFKVSFIFSKLLYYNKILHDRCHSLGARLWDVIRTLAYGIKLKSGIRSQPSLLVSFSGPDGSGKTQHAQALARSLATSALRTKYYWNRCGTSRFARFLSGWGKVLFRSRLGERVTKPGAPGRGERLQNPLLRFLWSYLVTADMVFSYFFQVRLPLLWGKIVICDRYSFDAAAEMECSLSANDRLSRLAIRMMLALVPKPNVAYLLDIPEDTCANRKDEDTDIDYLRRQRRAYTELADRYHLQVKKTDSDFSTLADEIVSEVMTPYFENFETFLNGLFLSNPSQLNKRKRGGER